MFVYGRSLIIILCIFRIEYLRLLYILSKLKTKWQQVKPGDQSGAALLGSIYSSLYCAVASNCEAKISKTTWLNKSMVLINLPEAPPISSRSSLQHSSVAPSRFGGLEEKGKTWHTITAGNLKSCWAATTHHWEFPDWMSNLSAIVATACSA